jgi:Metalloenzyme superfamily
MKPISIFCILFSISAFSQGQPKTKTENIILITLDGMRWQEVFTGAEKRLMLNKKFVDDTASLKKMFWHESPEKRREMLMPFFWQVISTKGQLYGNRALGSKVNTMNKMWFSYPGYNEILSGFADDEKITSNDKINNPNKNVLEFIQSQKGFSNKVAAFTSWETFPYIINSERNKIPVNSGVVKATGTLSDREKLLNELSFQLPNDEGNTRLDGLTFQYALEYLKRNNPKVLFISFDETDHYAHEGEYDRYLKSARYTDNMIGYLWEWVQFNPVYKDKTTLIITTDHGRGDDYEEDWKHHGAKMPNADEIWIAAIGPDTEGIGEMKSNEQLYQGQVAKTMAALLGLNYISEKKSGDIISSIVKK